MDWNYPAIAACIAERRPPSSEELAKVANRMRQEAFHDMPRDQWLERHILYASLAALVGSPN